MTKINCEVYFGNKDVGEMEYSLLDLKTGFLELDNICHNHLTAPKKWIEFNYEGKDFKIDACVSDGKIKVKNKDTLSQVYMHMKLDDSLFENTTPVKKMKI